MADRALKALPDEFGNVTQIYFDPATASITGIEVCDAQKALLYSLPIADAAQSAFQIVFHRLDLGSPANNQPDAGSVIYAVKSPKNPAITAVKNGLNFRYAVAARVIQPHTAAPSLPAFDTISVDVTIRSASDAASKGWIDFDIQFSYPSQITSGDARYGWEVVLEYPQIALPSTSASDLMLLNPAGRIGLLGRMLTPVGGATMPVQYAALYQTGTKGARNVVRGVAFAANDEAGHEKRLAVVPQDAGGNIKLGLSLICPIHLKRGAYVRPNVFKLSAGDAQGYGGAKMIFRVRAFQLEGAIDGAPVTWMDVAGLYRQWVRTRVSTIWRRVNPASRTHAPLEKMAPYTIVCNYSLDGATDAGDDAQTQTARWLEQHPMVAGSPDIAGNTNESLPALLNRVRSAFDLPGSTTRAPLEAQIWGFEMGGFYRHLGGLPPLTDLLGLNTSAFVADLISMPGSDGHATIIAQQPVIVAGRSPFDASSKKRGARLKADTQPRWPRTDVVLAQLWPLEGASQTHSQAGGRFPIVDYLPYWPDFKNRTLTSPSGDYIPYWLKPYNVLYLSPANQTSTHSSGRFPIVDYLPYWPDAKRRALPTSPAPTGLSASGDSRAREDDSIPYWPERRGNDSILWQVKTPSGPLSTPSAQTGLLAALIESSPVQPVLVIDLAGQGSRFQAALNDLNAGGIVPCITTSPMMHSFNRWRFRGHRLQAGGAWRDAIPYDFPIVMRAALMGVANTGGRAVEIVETQASVSAWTAQTKRYANGDPVERKNALGGFYQLNLRAMCPTAEVEQRYVNDWLHNDDHTGILDYGARLVEFMLHNYDLHMCYDRRHQHIEPKPASSAPYDNVIGYGPWYIKRMQAMLGRVNDLRTQLNLPFALANEFTCNENLVAYFDEWYDRASSAAVFNNTSDGVFVVPFLQFVFSELISARMDMIQYDTLSHSGYRERRITAAPAIAQPDDMLSSDLDATDQSFPTLRQWRDAAENYFEANFAIEQHGLAPAGYPATNGSTYSYVRGVQATMNLRSLFFRIGAAAVLGERMLLPAAWLEPPTDYLQEAIAMTSRAARMHMRFAPYFRSGSILGPVYITDGNRSIKTWRVPWRIFEDVNVLVENTINLRSNADEPALDLTDRISRATDSEDDCYPILLNQIQSRVWGKSGKNLYCLVNVGNSNRPLTLAYTHGMTSLAKPRRIFTFVNNDAPRASEIKNVKLGDTETFTLPARCMAAIEIG